VNDGLLLSKGDATPLRRSGEDAASPEKCCLGGSSSSLELRLLRVAWSSSGDLLLGDHRSSVELRLFEEAAILRVLCVLMLPWSLARMDIAPASRGFCESFEHDVQLLELQSCGDPAASWAAFTHTTGSMSAPESHKVMHKSHA
jgi:hypothetical protein